MCGPAAKTILNITRRNLLKGLGAASLTAAIPFRAESADSEPGQIVFSAGRSSPWNPAQNRLKP
ncbi:twin-arginine translocation signal domain-containing protein [Brucella abortus]|nr:twin-arginine translocation signal domain-containing protein [Brucella abortus]